MFDTYTLNTLDRITMLQVTGYEKLVKDYLSLFGVTVEYFKSKHKSGIPRRLAINDEGKTIRLYELRTAIVWFLTMNSNLYLREIAEIIGVKDHTSVIHYREKARDFFRLGDRHFTFYYETLMSCL